MLMRFWAIGLAWLVLTAVPANVFAKPAEPAIVKLILGAYEKKKGVRPTYESIEQGGGTITLRKFSFALGQPLEKNAPRIVTQSLVLENPTVDDTGLHHLARFVLKDMRVEGLAKDGKGLRVDIPRLVLEDVSILPPEQAKTPVEKFYAGSLLSSRAHADEVIFNIPDKPPLTLRGLRVGWRGDRRTGAGKGTFDLGRMTVPASLLAGGKGGDPLKELGYDELVFTGSGNYDAAWDDKQKLHLDFTFRLGAEEAGLQEFAITDLAIPLALLEKLSDREKQKEWTESLDKDPGAAMALTDGLTLRGLELAWVDHSLTNRLLDMNARKKGISRQAYIETLLAYPQVFLMQLGLPRLAAEATPQLRAFLMKPKSLAISVHAQAPMDLKTLMTLMADPAGLVETLNLKVEANKED